MEKSVLQIYCKSCGAPAKFDIVHQVYRCLFCGSEVTLEEARQEKEEALNIRHIRKPDKNYSLEMTTCSGCGASIIFEENEALSNCEFCGRSLVRKRYAKDSGQLPRYIVPFGMTKEEAAAQIETWCDKNSSKPEAGHLRSKIRELKGYYLPYEMVEGPVHCTVRKRSETTGFEADGYLNGEFINCSNQFDNLLLDAAEPYDMEGLQSFDFSYVAGHRVKISDLDTGKVTNRIQSEAEANYRLRMEKIWGTRSIDMKVQAEPVIRIPVLLPVYYLKDGDLKAAVNGQTGKVSVQAEKQGTFFSIPWWISGILVLLSAVFLTFGAMYLTGSPMEECLGITAVLGFFYLVVFLCMLQDGGSTEFGFQHYRLIYNSGEQTFHREKGRLVLNKEVLTRRIKEPVFRQELDGEIREVSYTFRSFKRFVSMIFLGVLTIFLPVIIALFLNGFDFQRLNLLGSGIWFLITVPIVPIYLVRFGIQWIYENPLVYVFTEDGKRKRYRKPGKFSLKSIGKIILGFLGALIVPPICFISWLVLGCVIATVYFTAFGF